MFILHKFVTRGVGVVSEKSIDSGKVIGYYYTRNHTLNSTDRIHQINGVSWYESYPLGRYVNHNHISPNLTAELDNMGLILKTSEKIPPHTELTIDYNVLSRLLDAYEDGTFKYDYHPEPINITKNII